jgi:hypothetical protein
MEVMSPQAPWFLSAMVGALCLLSGYRWIRFSSKLASAILAVLLGLAVGQQLQSGWAVAAILSAAAIAGFLLGNAYYYVNMALVGAIMGVLFMALGAASIGGTIEWPSGVASAVLGAMLAVRFERPIVIVGMSITGAILFLQSAQSLGIRTSPGVAALVVVALTLLGCAVQARTTKRPAAKPPAPRDP